MPPQPMITDALCSHGRSGARQTWSPLSGRFPLQLASHLWDDAVACSECLVPQQSTAFCISWCSFINYFAGDNRIAFF